ncbi:Cytochrome b-c1 complex subunit 10, fungi [Lasallia pustulata]|uniref:Cytochrome b-c1 complex subunit 10, fungi n=1 Tax=Lasallia pustulata TaxID=136370 RepID=A0A1W5D3K8_9LECA|nr:Cytochrome b-c1 complex subunit 10, fungi [Lasallia pustulata]
MSTPGPTGFHPPAQKPSYTAYRSPYGPNYKTLPNVRGISLRGATRLGLTAASFGGVAGVFALFFFSDVPKVRKDIMQRLPLIGDYFIHEVPPSDNPF